MLHFPFPLFTCRLFVDRQVGYFFFDCGLIQFYFCLLGESWDRNRWFQFNDAFVSQYASFLVWWFEKTLGEELHTNAKILNEMEFLLTIYLIRKLLFLHHKIIRKFICFIFIFSQQMISIRARYKISNGARCEAQCNCSRPQIQLKWLWTDWMKIFAFFLLRREKKSVHSKLPSFVVVCFHTYTHIGDGCVAKQQSNIL